MMHPSSSHVDCATLVELLRWRATRQPDQPAYSFLEDGDTREVSWTYGELDRQARAIGELLQQHSAIGARVLLLYPPGLAYIAAFFGCLYAGAIAVPAYPPNPARLDRTLPRLRAIANDARPSVILTTSPILSMAEALFAQAPDFRAIRWLASDALAAGMEDRWHEPALSAEALAFLQYTSGSTATPKGVMVSHGNLLHNQRMIRQAFEHTERSVVVGWLPLYHDMGLIGNVLQPLYVGFSCILMSPVAFLQRPLRWLQAISHYRATTSGGPNFAYDLCVQKISAEQRAGLDLSSWQVAFNGAERVHHETLERFARTFEACGFRHEALYPCYGLAEATLFVTGGTSTQPPRLYIVQASAIERHQVGASCAADPSARTLVSCGRTWLDEQVAIVDPETCTRCPTDRVGEIWIASRSIARGYWNRPADTQYTFQAFLADTGEGPFLRTGDLGFIQDGELFVTGRLKDMIIIEGRNHYPQDIELTVERSHLVLRPGCCAAFSVDVDGKERLVIVAEIERQYRSQAPGSKAADMNQVIKVIRQAVARHHDLQSHAILLLKTGSIPKTSSGKIQRHACRAGFLNRSLQIWAG